MKILKVIFTCVTSKVFIHHLFQYQEMAQVLRNSATHFATHEETEGVLLKLYLGTFFHQSFNDTLMFLRSGTEDLRVVNQIY